MKNYSRDELISKYKEFLMSSVSTSFKEPICIGKGINEYVYDIDGSRYLDFHTGIMVMNSGYCNKKITNAVIEQAKKIEHT